MDINISNSRLTLKNSFDLLDEEEFYEEVLVAQVAQPVDGELPSLTVDELNSSCKDVEAPIEKDAWIHTTISEASGKIDDGPSKNVASISDNPQQVSDIDKQGNEDLSFKETLSLVQGSIDRIIIPSMTTSDSTGLALEPVAVFIEQPILQPVITTSEFLGQDKSQVVFKNSKINNSAACVLDGKVLTKFWSNEDTDSTLDPKIDNDSDKTQFLDATKYLSFTDQIQKTKRVRQKMQKNPCVSIDTSPQHKQSPRQNMEITITRSHAGSKKKNNNKSTQ